MTERQKAWARLALLTVVGLFCPPLAAAKSGPTWAIYLLTAILYSLWALRVTKNARRDRSLGYLLSLADGVVLVPILVWSQGFAMRAVLIFLCLVGASHDLAGGCGVSPRRGAESSSEGEPRLGSYP